MKDGVAIYLSWFVLSVGRIFLRVLHLRNAKDGSIWTLKLSLSALLARIERHEVELVEFVQLFQILLPFRIWRRVVLLPWNTMRNDCYLAALLQQERCLEIINTCGSLRPVLRTMVSRASRGGSFHLAARAACVDSISGLKASGESRTRSRVHRTGTWNMIVSLFSPEENVGQSSCIQD